MRQLEAKIVQNLRVRGDFFRMRVLSAYLAGKAKPGQFVEIRCSAGIDPLLRRPFGIHRVVKGGIEILYEVVGKGTKLLSEMKIGGTVDVVGPLGNGFKPRKGRSIVVAGGNGVAPLLYLAEKLIKSGSEVFVLIGGCSKSHILCDKEFKAIGAEVIVTTEDSSAGAKGLVTNLLTKKLRSTLYAQRFTIYACGPTGMLRAVSNIALEFGIPCQVSLEEKMACGVGVCLGCPVKTVHGYKMVCKDGPVFDSQQIVWG